MGYCTKECVQFDDCFLGVGECIQLDGSSICTPVCITQTECAVYGPPSECGYTKAVDGAPVTTCADWLADLALPPDGSSCDDDEQCSLGHEGTERVCVFGQCTDGCRSDFDCPGVKLCSGTGGNPGSCG
jgi:hypothetical protein